MALLAETGSECRNYRYKTITIENGRTVSRCVDCIMLLASCLFPIHCMHVYTSIPCGPQDLRISRSVSWPINQASVPFQFQVNSIVLIAVINLLNYTIKII